jgi:hypothetical protein
LTECLLEFINADLAADSARDETLHLCHLFEKLLTKVESLLRLLTSKFIECILDLLNISLLLKTLIKLLPDFNNVPLVSLLNLNIVGHSFYLLNLLVDGASLLLDLTYELVSHGRHLLVSIRQFLIELDSQFLNLVFV